MKRRRKSKEGKATKKLNKKTCEINDIVEERYCGRNDGSRRRTSSLVASSTSTSSAHEKIQHELPFFFFFLFSFPKRRSFLMELESTINSNENIVIVARQTVFACRLSYHTFCIEEWRHCGRINPHFNLSEGCPKVSIDSRDGERENEKKGCKTIVS